MIAVADSLEIVHNHAIPTWFGIGGGAAQFATPATVDQLRQCVKADPDLRVLGDGANLLVDDDGVRELVISLSSAEFTQVKRDESTGLTIAGAGANLPKMIVEAVRAGLGGIEGLAGIPATIGGAVIMNAGGAFGQIADAVVRVHAINREGQDVVLSRDEIDFSYRHSGLHGLILTKIELDLREEDPVALRERLREVMDYKKRSQPMSERSAGCVFKNPTLPHDLAGIAPKGERVSAGMLIDKASCKGISVGGASVSHRHANFIVTDPKTAKARHVIELMSEVQKRVRDVFGVGLEAEVVVWSGQTK